MSQAKYAEECVPQELTSWQSLGTHSESKDWRIQLTHRFLESKCYERGHQLVLKEVAGMLY